MNPGASAIEVRPGGLLGRVVELWRRGRRAAGYSTAAAPHRSPVRVGVASDDADVADRPLMAAADEYLAARQAAGGGSMTPRRFEVDVHVSQIEFCARFLGVMRVRGTFGGWQALIQFVDGDPLASTLQAEVRAASLHTGIALRDRHLRGKDFLHVVAHPAISFRGTDVGRRASHFTVRGALTLRGITREEEIAFVPVPPLPGSSAPPLSLRFRGSLTIRRSDYGIWSPPTIGTMFGLRPRIIGDPVEVTFEVVAVSEHFSASVSSARSTRRADAAADR